MRLLLTSQFFCLLIVGHIGVLEAGTLFVDATDRGFYCGYTSPPHFPDSTNYLARVSAPGDPSRNFFVFDLSSVNANILTASLRLYNPGAAADGHDGYDSTKASATYMTYDVTTSITTLLSPPYTGGPLIYDDLGSGVAYGSQVVTASDNGRFVTVPLNDDFVAAANATDGPLAIGGSISSGWIFGYTQDFPLSSTQLVLTTVPEPSTLILLGVGVLGLLAYGWRKRA